MRVLDLRTLRKIEGITDELVEMAEKTLEDTKVYGRLCPKCKQWYPPDQKECSKCSEGSNKVKTQEILEEHQLRNLENMANAMDSVKALELFVRYQMGRHSEWRYKKFGEQVLEDFKKLEEKAKKLVMELAQEGQEKSVHLHLIRLYLGFLTQAFVASRPREGEKK